MTNPVQELVPYRDGFDADRQLKVQEMIAAKLVDGGEFSLLHVEDAQTIGRDILYCILREFRPDMFTDDFDKVVNKRLIEQYNETIKSLSLQFDVPGETVANIIGESTSQHMQLERQEDENATIRDRKTREELDDLIEAITHDFKMSHAQAEKVVARVERRYSRMALGKPTVTAAAQVTKMVQKFRGGDVVARCAGCKREVVPAPGWDNQTSLCTTCKREGREIPQAPENKFRKELAALINTHSLENNSDTPDYVTADFLCNCMDAFDEAVNLRSHDAGP